MRILLRFVACTQRNQAGLRPAEEVPYRGLRKQRCRQPGHLPTRPRDATSPESGGCVHCAAGTAAHRCDGRVVEDGAQPGCSRGGGWRNSRSLTSTRRGLEPQTREAARLLTATGRAAEISATDAIVAAYASACPDPVVLTSDPHDLIALSEHTARPIAVARS
jgi:hypothetical protein